jgi:hypothetical protein
MNLIIRIFNITLCLLIAFSFTQCRNNSTSECNSKKIELLLEDLFKKKEYFPGGTFQVYNPHDTNMDTLLDNSMYLGYLYSPNIKIPKKEFFLHWDIDSVSNYPDSVKLNVMNDPLATIKDVGTFRVAIVLLEVNEDTTKLKIQVDHGIGGKADVRGIITYLYNEKKCKWNVLDSTITYY